MHAANGKNIYLFIHTEERANLIFTMSKTYANNDIEDAITNHKKLILGVPRSHV